MILKRAPCGHFAIFEEDGSIFRQVCRCRIERPRRAETQREATFSVCDKCGGPWSGGLAHAPRLVGDVLKDCKLAEVKR